jgi:hypothetical protein
MVEKIIVAVIVGLIGLIPVLLQSLSNKRREKGFSSQLKKLQDELSFLEKWKTFSSTVLETKDQNNETANKIIGASLHSILEQYKSLNEEESKFKQEKDVTDVKQLSLFRRLFLLFLPQSFTGWILHSFFYFLVIFSTVMIISEIVTPYIDETSNESDTVFFVIAAILMFGIPAIILQRLAIKKMKKDLTKD